MRKSLLTLSFCAAAAAVIWHVHKESAGSSETTVSSWLSEAGRYIDLQASYDEDSQYPDPFEVGLFRVKFDSHGYAEDY